MKIIGEKSGFTLAETMILLAIIGIMTTIAIPNIIEWIPAKRVNGAIRNLAGDMQWTRMRAVADNNDYVIAFNTIQNTYSIYVEVDGLNGFNPNTDREVKRVNISAEYPGIIIMDRDGAAFGNTNPPRLTFSPTGRPFSPGHVCLIPGKDIDDSRTDRFRLITVIITGMVNIGDYSDRPDTDPCRIL